MNCTPRRDHLNRHRKNAYDRKHCEVRQDTFMLEGRRKTDPYASNILFDHYIDWPLQ